MSACNRCSQTDSCQQLRGPIWIRRGLSCSDICEILYKVKSYFVHGLNPQPLWAPLHWLMTSPICCHILHIGCEDATYFIYSCHCVMSFFSPLECFGGVKFKIRSYFQFPCLCALEIECVASVISKSIPIPSLFPPFLFYISPSTNRAISHLQAALSDSQVSFLSWPTTPDQGRPLVADTKPDAPWGLKDFFCLRTNK